MTPTSRRSRASCMAVVWIPTKAPVNVGVKAQLILLSMSWSCVGPEPKVAPPPPVPVCVAHAHQVDPFVRPRNPDPHGDPRQVGIDLNRGLEALDDHRYEEAASYLERAVANAPDLGLAHLSLAEALLYTGARSKERAHHLAWAVQLAPDNPRAHLRYAEYLGTTGDLEASRRQVACAIERRPSYAEAHRLAAGLDQKAGRLADAEQAARAAVRVDPADHRNWVILGEVLKARGAHAAAGQAILTAAETVGRSAPLYRRAAELFKAALEYDAAAAAYARADAIDPPPKTRELRPLPRARARRHTRRR